MTLQREGIVNESIVKAPPKELERAIIRVIKDCPGRFHGLKLWKLFSRDKVSRRMYRTVWGLWWRGHFRLDRWLHFVAR